MHNPVAVHSPPRTCPKQQGCISDVLPPVSRYSAMTRNNFLVINRILEPAEWDHLLMCTILQKDYFTLFDD
ncbi:hypothetical protein E4U41_000047 [Claviceps citrina]|nr:hypothetical protein E4U41_000047 [Claviceps citrina]